MERFVPLAGVGMRLRKKERGARSLKGARSGSRSPPLCHVVVVQVLDRGVLE